MPNVENLRKLIDEIERDGAEHLRMVDYCMTLNDEGEVDDCNPREYHPCHTAFCLCGYANLIRLRESGFDPLNNPQEVFYAQFLSELKAALWLGIKDEDYEELFHMNEAKLDRTQFDMLPAELRRKAAVTHLEQIANGGKVNWDRAFGDVGILERIGTMVLGK